MKLNGIDALKDSLVAMHDEAIALGFGLTTEFSYYTLYDEVTGEFTPPVITDSVNDSAVATTSIIEGEQALELLQQMQQNPNLIYVWGHSHVNMPVNPSGTDKNTIIDQDLQMAIISNNRNELNILLNEGGTIYEVKQLSDYTKISRYYRKSNTVQNGAGKQATYDWGSVDDDRLDDLYNYRYHY